MERPEIEGILERTESFELFFQWEVKRLAKYALLLEKALELACEYIGVDDCPACLDNSLVACNQCRDNAFEDCWKEHFLAQAKEATDGKTP